MAIARSIFVLMLSQRIYGEVRGWAVLHHKNVLRFFGTTSGFGPLPAFVTPWMERGSLTNYLSLEFFNLLDRDKFILVGPTTAKWFELIVLTTTFCSLNKLRQLFSTVRAGSCLFSQAALTIPTVHDKHVIHGNLTGVRLQLCTCLTS
jgi:serine/threonine protein kinase